MATFYYWIIKIIASSVISSAFVSWFEGTRMGVWLYAKIDQLMDWAAHRYNLAVLQRENRFLKKYPNVAKRIAVIEEKLNIDNSSK